jgi:UDP:flavonoid glycosyltransferase YjiC (YdhE family)
MRLLFASMPMDGHFNPLTGLAVHLLARGHDVRWYTAPSYASKLAELGIPHLPFVRATDVNSDNLTAHFPEYERLGVGPRAIAFATEKIFFGNLEAHLHDLLELRRRFAFEAIVFDAALYAGRLVAEKTRVPAYPVWAAPSPAPLSRTAPPPFFGLRPMSGPLGRLRDAVVWRLVSASTRRGMRLWHALRAREGLPPWDGNLFDVHVETSRVMFMAGLASLDFPRDDWPPNLRVLGALLPHRRAASALPDALAGRLAAHSGPVVVVSQGTVDNRDPEKLFVPALTALEASPHLVVATTGGRHTADLARRFPRGNVVVVDHADYRSLMPRAKLFISNGGYGSVTLALVHGVPLLLAGQLEGKNDVNARMDYRGLGVDLRTERPTPHQIARGVERVLGEPSFHQAVARVQRELAEHDAASIVERVVVGAEPPRP